jgi:hypothetical protein
MPGDPFEPIEVPDPGARLTPAPFATQVVWLSAGTAGPRRRRSSRDARRPTRSARRRQRTPDLLIDGTTKFDGTPGALCGIQREWDSGRSFGQRVRNLRGEPNTTFGARLNGTTPDPGFPGRDSFTYRVRDAAGQLTNVARVGLAEYVVTVRKPKVTAAERAGTVRVAIDLNRPATSALAVPYQIVARSARGFGVDFDRFDGTVAFAAGERTARVEIPVADDALDEGSETLEVWLADAGGSVAVGRRGTTIVTLADNDPTPGVSFRMKESAGPEGTAAALEVFLSAPAGDGPVRGQRGQEHGQGRGRLHPGRRDADVRPGRDVEARPPDGRERRPGRGGRAGGGRAREADERGRPRVRGPHLHDPGHGPAADRLVRGGRGDGRRRRRDRLADGPPVGPVRHAGDGGVCSRHRPRDRDRGRRSPVHRGQVDVQAGRDE